MDSHRKFLEMARLERAAAALRQNRMEAHVLQSRKEVLPLLQQLLPKGGTVAHGGSVTLAECGVIDLLRSADYHYLDRFAEGADAGQIARESFFADCYLSSVGAVTENGELYAVDARGNRVAALIFGPSQVIVIAGYNKLVSTREQARQRNFMISAPANTHRIGLKTPCATTGKCHECQSPDRICCAEVVLGPQFEAGRITVLLVCEDLGF